MSEQGQTATEQSVVAVTPEDLADVMTTRLFAQVQVYSRDFVYATGEMGLRLEVEYNSERYTPFGLTLTPDEARWLANELLLAAEETQPPLGEHSSS